MHFEIVLGLIYTGIVPSQSWPAGQRFQKVLLDMPISTLA